MDFDNENRNEDSVRQPEDDLFLLTETGSPVSSQEPEPSSAGDLPETDSGEAAPSSNPLKEPEFKINAGDLPSARILNDGHPVQMEKKTAVKLPETEVTLHPGKGASLGAMLLNARKAAGFTIEEVSEETRIRPEYIEALEADKISSLPNPVFLRAYVKAMSQLYRLDAASVKLLEDQMENFKPSVEIPEKLLEDIGRDGQISMAETRKLKMILVYGAVILLLLISLTVTSIISVSIRNNRRQAQLQQTDKPFDSDRLETLLPPQLPKPQMLQIPSSSETKQAR